MASVHLRDAFVNDIPAIEELYRRVAAAGGGLARSEQEITREYIEEFTSNSVHSGAQFVATAGDPARIVGEIHCYGKGIAVFAHILTDLTIAVDPEYQGQGIGRMLFTELLRHVQEQRPDILRVELFARESNAKALAFYESLGFSVEGRLKGRIRHPDGSTEDDLVMGWQRM